MTLNISKLFHIENSPRSLMQVKHLGLQEQLDNTRGRIRTLERELMMYKYLHGPIHDNKALLFTTKDQSHVLPEKEQHRYLEVKQENRQLRRLYDKVNRKLQEKTEENYDLDLYSGQLKKVLQQTKEEAGLLGRVLFQTNQGSVKNSTLAHPLKPLKGKTILYFGNSWRLLTAYRTYAAKQGFTLKFISPYNKDNFFCSNSTFDSAYGVVCESQNLQPDIYDKLKQLCTTHNKPMVLTAQSSVAALDRSLKILTEATTG